MKSEAETYYETNSELIDIIKAEESVDLLSEANAKLLLQDNGFQDNPITYDYSITGNRVNDTEVADDSTDVHPMYQTTYLAMTRSL